jgi:hypothetical protein
MSYSRITDGRTVNVEILAVERVGTSVNGNPTMDLTVREESGEVTRYRTMSDAGAGYSAANYRPSHRDGYAPVPAILTLTRAGRVRYMTRPDGRDA